VPIRRLVDKLPTLLSLVKALLHQSLGTKAKSCVSLQNIAKFLGNLRGISGVRSQALLYDRCSPGACIGSRHFVDRCSPPAPWFHLLNAWPGLELLWVYLSLGGGITGSQFIDVYGCCLPLVNDCLGTPPNSPNWCRVVAKLGNWAWCFVCNLSEFGNQICL
jgi:hypothetical protein